MFVELPYHASVLENDFGHVITVLAIDEEEGVNGKISYSIIDGNSQGLFAINSFSGLLMTVGSLDRETAEEHTLTIAAIDGGKPSLNATATVEIRVLDQNDNPPKFDRQLYMGSAKESQPQEQTVAVLTITDQDIHRSYSFNVNFTDRQLFYVAADPKNSSIAYFIATANLDREAKSSYMVQVELTDSASPDVFVTTTDVFVNVLDINDNGPIFRNEPYSFTLSENVTVGTSVFALHATDRDDGTNANVSYKLTAGNIGDVFDVDFQSGQVTVVSSLDREVKNKYRLTVEACDGGDIQKTAETVVEVTIEDVNDNVPVFTLSHYEQQVDEREQTGFSVLTVSASDADEGMNGNVSYSLDSTTVFAVDSESGIVTVEGALDHETRPVHNFTVIARDKGTPPLSQFASVTVFVLDHNDNAPNFSQSVYTANVSENLPNGTFVANLLATDRDSVATKGLLYSFELSSTGSLDKFSINRTSGVVTTSITLDRETQSRHELRVSVDDGQLKGYANLVVFVLDVNDNVPQFLDEPIIGHVTENQAANHIVIQLRAQDEDEGSNAQLQFSLYASYSNAFFINQSSGEVLTTMELDRELEAVYRFVAVVSDQGTPPLNESTVVEIRVQDVNDQAPVFTRTEYSVNISEDVMSGTFVVRVEAVDADIGSNAVITYRFATSPPDSFTIDITKGSITTLRRLDREQQDVFNLTIEAVDNGQPAMTGTATVVISVMDVNDNAPQLVVFPSKLYVREDEHVGNILLSVKATDLDVGENGIVSFYIVSGNVDRVFELNETTGEFRLDSRLDYEKKKVYIITVAVVDSGYPSLSTEANITVSVEDANDIAPMFVELPYNASVLENDLGHVITVLAIDEEEGVNGKISYSIIDGNSQGLFAINSFSGLLMTVGSLDRETAEEHTLTIAAIDGGKPSLNATATVEIRVLDQNDNPPKFDRQLYMGSAKESQPQEQTVAVLTITDQDIHRSYSFNVNFTDRQLFYVAADPKNSSIAYFIATANLDREAKSSYMVQVELTDSASPDVFVTTTDVFVNVLDINDNGPIFRNEPYSFTLSENVTVGTSVFALHATDRDDGTNANVSYKLTAGNIGDVFDVDFQSGQVTVVSSLDREVKNKYRLTVEACDGGDIQKTAETVVEVTIEDVNDNVPVFTLSHYEQQVDEREQTGFSVLTVSASDADEGMNGNVSYSLDSTTVFAVDSESGIVTVEGALDHETRPVHNFTVIARDKGTPPLSQFASVTVFVLDHNDNAPNFSQSVYTANVSENLPNGTFVANLLATDRDSVATKGLLYSFELSSTGSLDKFSINRTSGVVTTSITLDRETQSRHELRVSVDDGQLKGYANLVVFVLDVNDNVPQFLDEPIIGHVTENQAANHIVIQLRAQDEDEGSNAQLQFSLYASYSNAFFINQSSGEVLTTMELDRELEAVYRFVAVVSDQGTPPLNESTVVEIRVQDVNDQAPVFTRTEYSVNISEDVMSGTFVVRVEAVDADIGSNAVITYRFATSPPDSFTIDITKGSITTLRRLDREQQDVFNLTIEAVDNGQPAMTGTATVVISVMDVNDNAPQLVVFPSKLYVREDEHVGSILLSVKATDLDVGLNGDVEISLVGGNVGSNFNVTPSGLFSVARSLDRELIHMYNLTFQAQDRGSPLRSTTTNLLIEVVDVDDNDPVFKPDVYSVFLREDSLTGSSVVQVTAEDADQGSNAVVDYSLLSHADVFVVNRTSGLISTNSTLDRETTPEYNISVAANGLLTSVAVVIVTVEDVNDQAPLFDQQSYIVNVSEATPVRTALLTVAAVDADAGLNSYVTYAIIEGNEERRYDIDRISGVLSIAVSLDYEATKSYMLTIRASDGGIPSHHDFVTVAVTVRDANDNEPKFSQSIYRVTVPEDSVVGYTLAKLFANDDDSGENGQVSYRLDSNSSLFAVDPSTGFFYLTASLDYEKKTEYAVTVIGYDHGDPALTKKVNVSVIVSDVNDNRPFISVPSNTSIVYPEQGTAIDVAEKLNVTDLDTHSLYFIYNATVGLLKLNETLAPGFGLPCAFIEDSYKVLVNCNIHNRAIDLVSGSTRHGDVSVDNRGLATLNGGYIQVPNEYVYHLLTSGQLSVFLWISSETHREGTLFSKIHLATGLVYYRLTYTRSELVFKYLPSGASNSSDAIRLSCPHMLISSLSLWHYVGVVISYPMLTFYAGNSSCVRSLTHPFSDNIQGTVFVGTEQPGVNPLIAKMWGLFVTDYVLTIDKVVCLTTCTAPRLTGRLVLKRPLPFSGSIRVTHLDNKRSLLFEGKATVSEYEEALRLVQYHSQDEEPHSGPRQILFVVNDGNFSSPATIANVSIVTYSDSPPELAVLEDDPVLTEGQLSNIGHVICITDADANIPNIITAATASLSGYHALSSSSLGCGFEFKRSRNLASCGGGNAIDVFPFSVVYGNAQLSDSVLDLSSAGYAEYNASGLTINGQSATFSVFVKLQNANGFVFSKYSTDGLVRYSLHFTNNGQWIVFGYHSSSVGMITVYWFLQSAVNDGEWHHVAVVMNFPDIALFIDGVAHEVQYVNDTIFGNYSIPLKHRLIDGVGKLTIGAQSKGVMQLHGQFTRFEVWTDAADRGFIDCIIGCGEYLTLLSMHPLVRATFANGFRMVTLNGTATVQVYATLLSSIAYGDRVEEPAQIDRHLSVQVFNKDEASNSLMVDISVQLINDQTPELDLNTNSRGNNYTTSFEEGGHSVRLVGSNFNLTDSDSGTYNISSVVVNITNALDGSDEVVTAVTEGTDIVIFRMNNTLVLAGPASLEDFRKLLATTAYLNTAPEPSAVQRVISFVVIDTNTTLRSSSVFAIVNIVLVNDAPKLLFVGDPHSLVTLVRYNESDGKVHLISRGVDILDLDNSTMDSAHVSLQLVPDGKHETLGIFGSLPSGIQISFMNGTLVMTGKANVSVYEALFQSLYYENSDDNPTEITRRITIVVSDGLLLSEARYVTVSFSALNDPPELDINGMGTDGFNFSAVFTEGDDGIAITASKSVLLDVDSRILSCLHAQILNLSDMTSEWLYVAGSQSNIVCDYNYTHGILQCVGNATSYEYQGLLQSLQYNNSAEEPSAVRRIIEIQAKDLEGGVSSSVYATVDITFINDPPALNVNLTRVPVFTEGESSIQLLKDEAVSITDNDNSTFAFIEVIIQEPLNKQSEFLNVSVDGALSTRSDVGDMSRFYFSFANGPLPASAFIELLHSLVYSNVAPEPLGEKRLLEMRISDGKDLSQPIVMQLLINETNGFIPMLLNFSGTASVIENVSVGHVIDQVQALDGDGSDVVFFLLPDDVFVIDRLTGVITLNQSLDRESVSNYTLTVIATDTGLPARSVSHPLVVKITDVNDNEPVFLPRSGKVLVRENEAIGYVVSVIDAYDSDSGDNGRVAYFIESGDIGGVFAVNQTSGELTVTGGLDRELISEYFLTVLARDHGLPVQAARTTVQIDVLDANDNSPKFSQHLYSMSVDENKPIGSEVGRVSAIDADAGRNSNITFSIVFGFNNTFPEFVIEPLTGVLTTAVVLDREMCDFYSLVVVATDMGLQPLFGTAIVNVTVNDVNDNSPEFTNSVYLANVSEGAVQGTALRSVTARDLDLGASGLIVYSIKNGSGTGLFDIGRTNATIYLLGKLDRELVDSYTLIVTAIDHGSPFLTSQTDALVVISVLDENDNRPMFTLLKYTATVEENSPVGTSLVQVSASDSDSGSNALLFYSTSDMDVNSYLIFINQASGLVTVNGPFDFETDPLISLSVVVKDGGNPPQFSTATIDITVLDANDNVPRFSRQNYMALIQENATVGYTVLQVNATDRDGGAAGEITFSIITQIPSGHFSVDPVSGAIILTKSLNFESEQIHIVRVRAEDKWKPPNYSVTQVTIRVINVNDVSPHFAQQAYFATVNEELQSGTLVTQVSASDPDNLNANITFSIDESAASNNFSINAITGVVSTATVLDREVVKQLQIVVRATENGDHLMYSTVLVTVRIEDINDHSPVFAKLFYNASVAEDTRPGSTVFTVLAEDADVGVNSKIMYHIVGGSGVGQFDVDSTSGAVSLNKFLDREVVSNYSLILQATDGGNPMLTAEVTAVIMVTDVNDNSPSFSQSEYHVRVSESASLNTTIGQVLAVDRDLGSNGKIVYSLAAVDLLRIDSFSGSMHLNGKLDYENKTTHRIEVFAHDFGKPQQSSHTLVVINVIDSNDNSPMFTADSSTYTRYVMELDRVGVSILQVFAVDKDAGTNSQITYHLQNSSLPILFTVNSVTGVVTNTAPLDRETMDVFAFEINAVDGGSPAQTAVAMVSVNILDINDNHPVFDRVNYTFFVHEGEIVGSPIGQVVASDVDLGENGTVVYSLADGTFNVTAINGLIVLARSLDHDNGSTSHEFLVEARDLGSVSLSGSAVVRVVIGDINDNAPVIDLDTTNSSSNNYQTSFVEQTSGSVPVVSKNVMIFDADVLATVNFSSVSVTLVNPVGPEDVLFSEMSSVFDVRVTIGPSQHSAFLRGPASSTAFVMALQYLRYNNTNYRNPQQFPERVIRFEVSDGGMVSQPVNTTVRIVTVTDPPYLFTGIRQHNSSVEVKIGTRSAHIAMYVTVIDPDSSRLVSAVITLQGNEINETVVCDTTGTNITAVIHPAQVVLTGVDSIRNYTVVLRSVQFLHYNLSTTEGQRLISFVVRDDSGEWSEPSFVIIALVKTALVDLNGIASGLDYSILYKEMDGKRAITSQQVRVITQSGMVDAVNITLEATPDGAAEVLTVESYVLFGTKLVQLPYSSASRQLVLLGPDKAENFEKALLTLRYKNTEMKSIINNQPSLETRKVSFIVTEGNGESPSSTTLIEFSRDCDLQNAKHTSASLYDVSSTSRLQALSPCHSIIGSGVSVQCQSSCNITSLLPLMFLQSVKTLELKSLSVTSFAGLGNLINLESLLVEGNTHLTTFDGFSQRLMSLSKDLVIKSNPHLVSISGLSSLHTISGKVEVRSNAALKNLRGLESLQTIGQDLIISLSSVESLDGLQNLTTIGRLLSISDNSRLLNVNALSGLMSIGSDMYVFFNGQLLNLDGLHNVVSVGRTVFITGNSQLCYMNGQLLKSSRWIGIAEKVVVQLSPTCLSKCSDSPCKNNGNCSDLVGGGFSCSCQEGYSGLSCSSSDTSGVSFALDNKQHNHDNTMVTIVVRENMENLGETVGLVVGNIMEKFLKSHDVVVVVANVYSSEDESQVVLAVLQGSNIVPANQVIEALDSNGYDKLSHDIGLSVEAYFATGGNLDGATEPKDFLESNVKEIMNYKVALGVAVATLILIAAAVVIAVCLVQRRNRNYNYRKHLVQDSGGSQSG
ncbi:protocadherin Fat 3-like [Corticium candelabrum]|uniref:protocadherin Fat 3-like n=1 Tax=Corticium candelabrum TaxID=121492 RepID=UPI002E35FC4F|nr:protocadherin Fat 3-like [Corticium candelabrum]